MRIAQVCPLYESVPPKLYGGTERVVSYITEELVKLGHEVTLFASGDSETSANLCPIVPKALRLNKEYIDHLSPHVVQLQEVVEQQHEFDIIHYHTDYLHYPLSSISCVPTLTTLHGRLDLEGLESLYSKFSHIPLISISNDQRRPLSTASPNWIDTIYHGLPMSKIEASYSQGEYLAFVGRISPEKRVDRAIEIAIKAQLPLKIAAKVDNADSEYFEKSIRSLLDHPLIEFLGEISEDQKDEFFGKAKCLLFPIDWPEPFGLVMIEAMARATPVVAYPNGSVREIITPSVNGEIVSSIEDAVSAVKSIGSISRRKVREHAEERFDVMFMATRYLNAYRKVISDFSSKKIRLLKGGEERYDFAAS